MQSNNINHHRIIKLDSFFFFYPMTVEIRRSFVGYLDGFGLLSAILVKPKWHDCSNSLPDARNCHLADFKYVENMSEN